MSSLLPSSPIRFSTLQIMDGEESIPQESIPIEFGEPVYDRDGEILGYVSGLTDDGFEVAIIESEAPIDKSTAAGGDANENLPGQEFGEGYLMWRCGECGEMGDLDKGIPETCPNCGSPEDVITKVEED